MTQQMPLTSQPEAPLGYLHNTQVFLDDPFATVYQQDQDMSTNLDWVSLTAFMEYLLGPPLMLMCKQSLFDMHVQNSQTDETMIPWETFFNRATVVS
jgi:hypothetical protein